MAKVTSKYRVTIPKRIADAYHIRPGDEIDWIAAGEAIRVVPARKKTELPDRELRLRLFDQATERHKQRINNRDASIFAGLILTDRPIGRKVGS